jgi:hypothetical protein
LLEQGHLTGYGAGSGLSHCVPLQRLPLLHPRSRKDGGVVGAPAGGGRNHQ